MNEIKFLKLPTYLMISVGMLPLNSKRYPTLNLIHKCWGYLLMVWFLLFLTSLFVEIFHQIHGDIFDLLGNLSVSLLFVITGIKGAVCLSSISKKLMNQVNETERKLLLDDNGDDDSEREIHLKYADWANKLNLVFLCLAATSCVSFQFFPLILQKIHYIDAHKHNITDYFERTFSVETWLPFDKFKYYGLAYSLIAFGGITGATLTILTDGYMWACIIFGISQIKRLQYKLKLLQAHAKQYSKTYNTSLEVGYKHVLRKCFILHQEIIQYIIDLNKMMSFAMLIDFGVASIQIATLGVLLIFTDFGIPLIISLNFLIAVLCQLGVFYWHGNELTLEGLAIQNSIWNTEFYEFSREIQGDLRFMMLRAQIPLILTVGPFYAMSNATGIAMIKASYSYITLIRQFYQD